MGSPRSRVVIRYSLILSGLFVLIGAIFASFSFPIATKTVTQRCSWAADGRTRYSLLLGQANAYQKAPLEYQGALILLACDSVDITYKLYLL